ncbi:hypothetical protein D3C72_850280 [compost metagenome]
MSHFGELFLFVYPFKIPAEMKSRALSRKRNAALFSSRSRATYWLGRLKAQCTANRATVMIIKLTTHKAVVIVTALAVRYQLPCCEQSRLRCRYNQCTPGFYLER